MPKKRTLNFKLLQGSSTNSSGVRNDQENALSVNEKLQGLRRLEAKDAEAKKRQLADAVNQRSVPPDVRSILGFSESAPPKPKRMLRTQDRRRTPGPAPPKSWLAGPSSLRLRSSKATNASMHSKPAYFLRFARMTALEDEPEDEKPASLKHISLKVLAESWGSLDAEDLIAFAEIPLRLRLRLLAYISFYGGSLNISGLRALLDDSESVPYLDLAGLVGHDGLTIKKICKYVESSQRHAPQPRIDDGDLIADSWDLADSLEATLSLSPSVSRFASLTHLCLSHPAPTVSWPDLLALSKHLPQITHLSLAYWPRPTRTPNLSTTTVSSQHSPDVTAGGSHYYSAIDHDLSEPASLLRQLSHSLLCLQWLDLEGCEQWMPALGRLAIESSCVVRADRWAPSSQPTPSIFASNWKNLTYIRCAQGWLPALSGIRKLSWEGHSTLLRVMVVEAFDKYLQKTQVSMNDEHQQPSQDVLDMELKRGRIWLDREEKVAEACMRIHSSRRAHGLRRIEMDLGWTKRLGTIV